MVFQNRFQFVFVFNVSLVLGIISIMFFVAPPLVRANLLLNPTRVILDDRNKSGAVTVINQAAAPVKYRVSTTLYRYQSNCVLKEIIDPTPEENKLKELVRFSPRQSVLQPRGSQKIRLQFRRHRDLAQGEYRIHLKVNPVPVTDSSDSETLNKPGVKINLLVGVAIPVVIRNGKLWAKATPVSCNAIISKHTGLPALEVAVKREGTRSVIMDIEAYHLQNNAPPGGKYVGNSRNAVIYPEFDTGTFEIPMDKSISRQLQSGRVRIDIKDSEIKSRKGKKATLLGSGEFKIRQVP